MVKPSAIGILPAGVVVATLGLSWLAPIVAAQEYCVACTEPAKQYRCVIDNAQPNARQSLQLLCITTLARDGRHASCEVTRGTVFECKGPVARVSGAEAATAPPAPVAAGPPPAVSPAATPTPPLSSPTGEPKTVVEAVKRANAATEAQLKKSAESLKQSTDQTGNAISEGAKKTWNCLMSLFTRCK